MSFEFQREQKEWPEAEVIAGVEAHRGLIFRGIAELIRYTLAQNPPPVPKVLPMADFTDYCSLMYRLLRALEQVADKQPGFADEVFAAWDRQQSTDQPEDSAGPFPRLLEALIVRWSVANPPDPLCEVLTIRRNYTYGPHTGCLFIATPNGWLSSLKEIASRERDVVLPARPAGLRRRLKALKPEHGYILLTEQEDNARYCQVEADGCF